MEIHPGQYIQRGPHPYKVSTDELPDLSARRVQSRVADINKMEDAWHLTRHASASQS